jgi:hypothetical protein
MDGYTSAAGEQTRQHHEETMLEGDREAWWLHTFLNHSLNITVVCRFNKVFLVNLAIGYFCIQWRLNHSFQARVIPLFTLSKLPLV